MFKVGEGEHFRKSISTHGSGLPKFEEHLVNLKWELERGNFSGERLHPDNPRYVTKLSTGTVDWQILVDYKVDLEQEEVVLIQILPYIDF